jgi:hypothetical protein
MSNPVQRALLFSLACFVTPSAAAATPAAPPAWQRQTVELRCGPNLLAISIEARGAAPATLGRVTVNGRRSAIVDPDDLERFLASIRGTSINGVSCQSPTALVLGVSGSRLAAHQGDEDDVVEVFNVSLRDP